MRTWGGMGRTRPPGAAAGLVGTVLVHGGALALLFTAVEPPQVLPPVYAVELVAAPAPAPRQRLAPEARPAPPPEPPPAPVKSTPEPAEVAPPKPKPIEPKVKQDPAPKTRADAEPLPGEQPSTGTDVATVKTPGLQFPYPEYLRNLMNEVLRRFGSQNSRLSAQVSFLIMRDGTVREIKFVERSGNFSFDLDAQGAIEAASNAGSFGTLPDGWESDVLPVVFVFEPR